MSFNDFKREPFMVRRSTKPVYTCERVLSTDSLPIVGFDAVTTLFPVVFAKHSRPWYLHYRFYGNDPADMVKRVPSIINAFNRSRTLRKAKISGIRICNVDCSNHKMRYVTDMVVSSSYGAILMAALANNFEKIDNVARISFYPVATKGLRCTRDMKRAKEVRHQDLVEKFFRRSKLSRHSCTIDRHEDEDPLNLGIIEWEVRATRSLFDIVYKIIEVLYDDILDVSFGTPRFFVLSKTPTADVDNYLQRPVDKLLHNLRYKRASAFGIYCKNPEYPLF